MRSCYNLIIATGLFFLALLAGSSARAEVTFTPHVSVLEEYDSNITYAQDEAISDMITRLQFGFDAQYEGKVDILKFKFNIFHRFFNKYSTYDNTGENASLSLSHEFDRYNRITASDTFTHGTEPTSFDDEFGRSSGRYTFTKNEFDTAFTHDFTSQLSGIVRYGNEVNSYSREDLSDSTTNYIGGGVEYAITSRTIALGDYRLSRIDYSQGGDAVTNTLTAGARHYFSSQLNLQAVAGLDFLRTANKENETNPVVVVTLTDDLTDQLEAKLTYLWQSTASTYNSDVFDNQKISAGLADQVSERLKVDFSLFYGQGEYELSKVEETLKGFEFGFQYDLFPRVALTGRYNFAQRTTNELGTEYDRQYVSAGIRIEF